LKIPSSPLAGSRLSPVRATAVLLLVGLALLLGIVGASLWLVDRTADSNAEVIRAREVRSAAADLRSLVQDAETGQRGYLLTGETRYLTPYSQTRSRIVPAFEHLRALVRDDPAGVAEVDRLASVVNSKLVELDQTIALERAGLHDQALAVVDSGRGKALMDASRDGFAQLVAAAEARLDQSLDRQGRRASALRWVTIAGGVLIILAVGGSAWTVLAYTLDLIVARGQLEAMNEGLEQRVRERTADLERANEEIQRFAYIVSHDLRAPLVNIMGFTSELEASLQAVDAWSDGPLAAGDADEARVAIKEDLPESIAFIRASTSKMDRLINAILKLSRQGQRVLGPEAVDLAAVLEASAASVRHAVSEADGEVVVERPMPPIVSDRLALEQVFGNLIDNAVKYRAADRPPRISVRSRAGAAGSVVIEVEDNGRGIGPEDYERVFELFRRSGSQDQPGEGIGLAHVRALVRRLHGEITVESVLGRGSTFRVVLPRDLSVFLETSGQ
jgi:signal transduction histidine kinase